MSMYSILGGGRSFRFTGRTFRPAGHRGAQETRPSGYHGYRRWCHPRSGLRRLSRKGTINFVFPLQSRCRSHLRPRHPGCLFGESGNATFDAGVKAYPLQCSTAVHRTPDRAELFTLKGKGAKRAAFSGGSFCFVVNTAFSGWRHRRRGLLRYKRFSAL